MFLFPTVSGYFFKKEGRIPQVSNCSTIGFELCKVCIFCYERRKELNAHGLDGAWDSQTLGQGRQPVGKNTYLVFVNAATFFSLMFSQDLTKKNTFSVLLMQIGAH